MYVERRAVAVKTDEITLLSDRWNWTVKIHAHISQIQCLSVGQMNMKQVSVNTRQWTHARETDITKYTTQK